MTADGTSVALADIRAERVRQLHSEGWTESHDDAHDKGEMAAAAAAYAIHHRAHLLPEFVNPNHISADHGPTLHTTMVHASAVWPWHAKWWKPRDARRNLVRAAALIVAEIERLDRAAKAG